MRRFELAPGAKIGIVGGGQLGRMLAATARRMGFLPFVLAPENDPPAAHFAAGHRRASLDDVDEMTAFARQVDVMTFEFENVSSAALAAAAAVCEVRPSPQVLHHTQDRVREKAFLSAAGLPQTANAGAATVDELTAAVAAVGTPCVVKSAGFGYDGKGQALVASGSSSELAAARELALAGPVVIERFVDLHLELSVVIARGADGRSAAYRPFVNRHVGHILDVTLAPFAAGAEDAGALGLGASTADEAVRLAEEIAAGLGAVGLVTVEFFVTRSGELLVNEIAPRPHNSGHLTIEAAETSQFEQQLRAVCGLPLGSARLTTPAAMANLLGELWSHGEPRFAAALQVPGVRLHLYGKREARVGRKMGHLTATGSSVEESVGRVVTAREALRT